MWSLSNHSCKSEFLSLFAFFFINYNYGIFLCSIDLDSTKIIKKCEFLDSAGSVDEKYRHQVCMIELWSSWKIPLKLDFEWNSSFSFVCLFFCLFMVCLFRFLVQMFLQKRREVNGGKPSTEEPGFRPWLVFFCAVSLPASIVELSLDWSLKWSVYIVYESI